MIIARKTMDQFSVSLGKVSIVFSTVLHGCETMAQYKVNID